MNSTKVFSVRLPEELKARVDAAANGNRNAWVTNAIKAKLGVEAGGEEAEQTPTRGTRHVGKPRAADPGPQRASSGLDAKNRAILEEMKRVKPESLSPQMKRKIAKRNLGFD